MVKCQSCGASYEPASADGVVYFHACPPLASHELKAAFTGGTLQLSPASQARLDAATAIDAKRAADAIGPLAVDAFFATLTIERPNKRDENILKGATAKAPAVIKATGAGVVDVAPPAAPDAIVAAHV